MRGATRKIARGAVSAAIAAACVALACGPAPEAARSSRPKVAVSVLPQAWLVERLAGDGVEIAVMIPPGASPATFEPEFRQIRALADASLYLKVGHPHFPFEAAWIDRLLSDHPELRVIDLAQGAASAEHDPHLWLSPVRMGAMIDPVVEALASVFPQEQAAVRARAASVREEVMATDAALRRILAPARGKAFLSLHPAWGYLAEDYELVQIAVEHENKAPNPYRLAELVGRARALGIQVVFAQPQFDPTSAALIAEEIGGRVELIDPLARDWAANLERVARLLAEAARG